MAYRFTAKAYDGRALGSYVFPDHGMANEYGRDLLACPEAGALVTRVNEDPGPADAIYIKSRTPGTMGLLSWVNPDTQTDGTDPEIEALLADLQMDPQAYL